MAQPLFECADVVTPPLEWNVACGTRVRGRFALDASNIQDAICSILEVPDLNQRIAGRVRELRAARGLSLEALAGKSGVSRSMISLIERGGSSPTAVVLEKLATGLGVMLASLFDAPPREPAASPLARRAEQAEWRDPASGYVRRNVSPAGIPAPVQIVEVRFPPGARVAFETAAREARVHQQVWVLEGSIEITLGAERHRLREGDCLGMLLDRPIMFHNPTRKPTRYAVVIAAEPSTRR
jgi:transcriptional regulator with XRE-family HTH domain